MQYRDYHMPGIGALVALMSLIGSIWLAFSRNDGDKQVEAEKSQYEGKGF